MSHTFPLITLGAALLSTTMFATPAAAEDWQFRASLYGYFPDISSNVAFQGADEINVSAQDLIDHTDNIFMGSFEAQRGRFGVFADVIYINLGNSITDSTSIAVGGGTPLPPGITADASLNVDAWVWTLAGTYRIYEGANATIDLFGGARLLNVDADLAYEFSSDFGPFSGPARAGATSTELENWDAVVGVKGRNTFGANQRWFVTYYADVGAGDSDLTWQAFVGGGRSIGRFDIVAGWRHLEYEFPSSSRIEDLTFDGPLVGASFNF